GAAPAEAPDRLGDVAPAQVLPHALLDGQERLVEQEEAISPPADGRDHAGRAAPAGSRNHLSREVAPRTRAMEDGGMESASARSSITARLAPPSSGTAVTRTRSVPACQPTMARTRALGCTRTWSSPPPGAPLRIPRVPPYVA